MARYRKRVSHAKEAFYIVCIMMVLLIGLFAYVGPGGYREMREKQAELAAKQSRVNALKKSKQEHENNIGNLGDNRKNNDAIEIYARKKGYGKKGEIIQEIPQPEKDQPPVKK